jgi:hypothetical protein
MLIAVGIETMFFSIRRRCSFRVSDKAHSIWQKFCSEQRVEQEAVPLFAEKNGRIEVQRIGNDGRPVLCRSREMEAMVEREVGLVAGDASLGGDEYDGLIYLMCTIDKGEITPLYIGKTEKFGLDGGNLSVNIKNIATDRTKFARWGNGYAYHIGDLSAVVLPGHSPKKQTKKYRAWADSLFEEYPTEAPKLRQPVYYWGKAWRRNSEGPWAEIGETPLAFLENQLIGVASLAFPETLLNSLGVNRS